MKTFTANELNEMTMSQLVEIYNEMISAVPHGDKVNRFATKNTGINRITTLQEQLVDEIDPWAAPTEVAPDTEWEDAQEEAHVVVVGEYNPKRADGQRRAWADPEVAAARSKRTKVKVDGVVYRSVRAAFAELGLPDEKHQAFRKELFATESGRKSFEGHRFTTVVEAE